MNYSIFFFLKGHSSNLVLDLVLELHVVEFKITDTLHFP